LYEVTGIRVEYGLVVVTTLLVLLLTLLVVVFVDPWVLELLGLIFLLIPTCSQSVKKSCGSTLISST
jgi:hypothetical protein